ncbi:putative ribonuclease H-like domain-containing protein [Tanacetum coccineum]|uniref:Ribonuclease H-like domain-containing protein n=1 Tax=Tanacetum coccineum TaxID=301880 RepID=A0ABQ5DWT6_9ASTR
MFDESLMIPLEELRVDDKLHFMEELVEVMDREIKKLKRSRIPIVKVRWNSKRGPEFTWEREDQFKHKGHFRDMGVSSGFLEIRKLLSISILMGTDGRSVGKKTGGVAALRNIDHIHFMDFGSKGPKIKWGITIDDVWKEQPNDVKQEFLSHFQDRFAKPSESDGTIFVSLECGFGWDIANKVLSWWNLDSRQLETHFARMIIDYALWEVIENGATLPKTTTMEGIVTEMPITTAKEKGRRRLEKLLELVESDLVGMKLQKKAQRKSLKQQSEIFMLHAQMMIDLTFIGFYVALEINDKRTRKSRRSVPVDNSSYFLQLWCHVMVLVDYDWCGSALSDRGTCLSTDYEEIDGGIMWPFGPQETPKEEKSTLEMSPLKLVPRLVGILKFLYNWDRKILVDHKVKLRTTSQNRVAERRNRTRIEAARTMLADSKLLTTFWAEAVNTACYVQNRVLVVKPHTKTPYELFHGRTPTLSFMRPFGFPVTILNTINHLGKFNGKADEGFFVGCSLNSKAFRVFNSRTRIVEENLHIRFSESTPNVVGSGLDLLFDIDALTRIINYEPIVAGTQSNGFAGTKASDNAGQARKETEPVKDYILLPLWTADPPFSQDPKSSLDDGSKPSSDDGKKVDEDPRKESEYKDQEKEDNVNNTKNVNTVSSTVNAASTNEVNAVGGKTSIELPFVPNMTALEDDSLFDFSRDDEDDGAMADMNNLDTTIQVSPNPTIRIHKDHPIDQVIGDLQSTTQTRNMSKNLEEHGFVSTIQQRTNHKDLQNCLFAYFLSQEEPKKVIHALKDPSCINLNLFPFSLTHEAESWFYHLKTHSIHTWEEMILKFLSKYYPHSRALQLRKECPESNFQQCPWSPVFKLGKVGGNGKSSGSTTSHSNHSLSEYESFCFDVDHIEEKSSGSTTSHSDLSLPSLPEYKSFHFDLSIDPLPPFPIG